MRVRDAEAGSPRRVLRVSVTSLCRGASFRTGYLDIEGEDDRELCSLDTYETVSGQCHLQQDGSQLQH